MVARARGREKGNEYGSSSKSAFPRSLLLDTPATSLALSKLIEIAFANSSTTAAGSSAGGLVSPVDGGGVESTGDFTSVVTIADVTEVTPVGTALSSSRMPKITGDAHQQTRAVLDDMYITFRGRQGRARVRALR
jgi:hypothetical protein